LKGLRECTGLSLPQPKNEVGGSYECGDYDGRPELTWTSTAEILMGTLTRTENPEDDTREEQKIRQVAEVPSRT
jgi:hypothetical protein